MSEKRDHFSASQINRFLSEPALWVLDRLYGVRGFAGPGAWRGTAVEAALDAALFSRATDEQALEIAYQTFDREAQGQVGEDVEKAKSEIPAYLKNLLPSMRALGIPLTRQARISLNLEGIDAEVIGYVDYLYPDKLYDLKTTGRMPSIDEATNRIKDKWEHLRQMAIYERAKKIPPTLIYVTPGKPDKGKDHKPPLFYTPCREELDAAMRQVECACRAMQRIIRSRRDPDEIAEMYPPRDLSGYLWDAATRAKATEIWKL